MQEGNDLEKETERNAQTRDDVSNFISACVGKEARAMKIWGKGARAKRLQMRRQACTRRPYDRIIAFKSSLNPGTSARWET